MIAPRQLGERANQAIGFLTAVRETVYLRFPDRFFDSRTDQRREELTLAGLESPREIAELAQQSDGVGLR